MTQTAKSEAGTWVDDYVTSTGVHVSGHWRRSRSGQGADTSLDAVEDLGTDRSPGHRDSPAPAAAGDHVSEARTSASPADRVGSPKKSREAEWAAAKSRLSKAQVQIGLAALRPPTEESTREHAKLVAARDQAQRDVFQARADMEEHDAPSSPEGEAPGSQSRQCPSCGQFAAADHTCPTPVALPSADYGSTSRDVRTKEMLGDLETSIQAIVDSGELTRWLDAMSSNGMARWSMNNRILAAMQMYQRGEDISDLHLMGFRQWSAKFNRNVIKGEKAVWILAPMTRKFRDEEGDDDKVRVVGFKAVPVFNVSQTEGDPLPEAPVAIVPGEATSGTVEGLQDRVASCGYTYEEAEIPDFQPGTAKGTLGYTDPASKRIVVDPRLTSAQKASTIAHELAHVHCGHVDGDVSEYRKHRGRMETEAEMTAYLVNRSRGMPRSSADEFSPGYIAGWSRGDPTVVRSAMDRATKAFNKIMDGPWPS